MEKKIKSITKLIGKITEDPKLSQEEKIRSLVAIAGFVFYSFCPDMESYDKMASIIKQEFLRIKGENLSEQN